MTVTVDSSRRAGGTVEHLLTVQRRGVTYHATALEGQSGGARVVAVVRMSRTPFGRNAPRKLRREVELSLLCELDSVRTNQPPEDAP